MDIKEFLMQYGEMISTTCAMVTLCYVIMNSSKHDKNIEKAFYVSHFLCPLNHTNINQLTQLEGDNVNDIKSNGLVPIIAQALEVMETKAGVLRI